MELHHIDSCDAGASFQLVSQPFASRKLALAFLSVLIASEDEFRHTSDWNHRRQRFVSDGRGPRAKRTQDRYAVRTAVGHARWRQSERASGLFFAAARPWSPDFATRN